MVDMHTALGKKRVTTRWELDQRKGGSSRVTKRCTMCLRRARLRARDASSSITHSQETLTNAYFHVDEDEECDVDPPAEWLEQQAALGNPTSVLWRLRRQLCGPRRAGTRWVDFMAERIEAQSFDRCDAAPQFFANYDLHVFIKGHMDDLRGTGPRPALELVQTNLSQTIRFKIWTVYEVGMKYENLKRERVLHNKITPNPKHLRVVLHSMGLTNCKPAPTPSSRNLMTMLTWTCKSADTARELIVGGLAVLVKGSL